jgi:hypothetical protein
MSEPRDEFTVEGARRVGGETTERLAGNYADSHS